MRTAVAIAAVSVALAVACAASPRPTTRADDSARASTPTTGRIACPPGRGDCDGDPANGCESDLGADPENCRACGNACAGAGMAMCVDGRCARTATR